jgi:hypothetical protein
VKPISAKAAYNVVPERAGPYFQKLQCFCFESQTIQPGETVLGDLFSTAPGGKGANQALAACRAGAQVRMVGAVGHDAFASEALVCLRESGIDLVVSGGELGAGGHEPDVARCATSTRPTHQSAAIRSQTP